MALQEVEAPPRAPLGEAAVEPKPVEPPRLELHEVRLRPKYFRRQDLLVLLGSALSSLSLTWLVYFRLTPLSGGFGFLVAWYLTFLLVYWLVEREVDDRLQAKDRLAMVVIGTAAVAVLVPLVLILWYVVKEGVTALRPRFFTQDQQLAGGAVDIDTGELATGTEGGGAHAIIGTLQQVGLAVVLSVPIAVLTAIFLNEVGGRLARPVRLIVDAMSGLPSIVAGLFIYAVFIAGLGYDFSGALGSLALSVLMLPTVTRTAEVVLRLVPGGLREASLALGAPEWRTAWSVVLPTARAGLITAVLLGVARAVGETAPLIVTTFGNDLFQPNLFAGPQESLPTFVYTKIRDPFQSQIDRAWTGALVLVLLVLVLFVAARIVGRGGLGRTSGRDRRRPVVTATYYAPMAASDPELEPAYGDTRPLDDTVAPAGTGTLADGTDLHERTLRDDEVNP